MVTRVASLLPSATEIVAALDLAALLVGRSHERDHPPAVAALPVLTSSTLDGGLTGAALHDAVGDRVRRALALFAVDEAALAALAPDVILTQTLCAVCAVGPDDLAAYVETVRPGVRLVALDGVDLASVFADVRRVAEACGEPARAAPLIEALRARLDAIARAVAGARRPRIACLEWLAPLMTAGNWGPELAAIAGGEAVLARAGVHSGTVELAQLVAADPDVIVIAPCGFDLARAEGEMYWMTGRPGWRDLRAVREGRVFLADGNQYFNRPGPRAVETLEILVEMLHGSASSDGSRWRSLPRV
ncbi:MAG: ABC transporter substrate-binding protein, partial [Alphaproteobacteria bacterium]|nr:ABC transporter substrate-binding protein [Alphaproteobacteria bacterium]